MITWAIYNHDNVKYTLRNESATKMAYRDVQLPIMRLFSQIKCYNKLIFAMFSKLVA